MYRNKLENEKAKAKLRKQHAEQIADWAERKQRAHDQMIITRMMYGH